MSSIQQLWANPTTVCPPRKPNIMFVHVIINSVLLETIFETPNLDLPAHISIHMLPPSANAIMWAAYLQVRTYFCKYAFTAITCKSVKKLLGLNLFPGCGICNMLACCSYLPHYLQCALFDLFYLYISTHSCCCCDPYCRLSQINSWQDPHNSHLSSTLPLTRAREMKSFLPSWPL